MYPGSNNYNNQYPNYQSQQPPPGGAQIGFNVGQPGYNQPQSGGFSQQYVAGAPCPVPGINYQPPQGQYYGQQNQGSSWNPNQGMGQNPNQGMGQNPNQGMGQNPQSSYGGSYQPTNQPYNPQASYGGSYQPMGQQPMHTGGTCDPIGQPQNLPVNPYSNQQHNPMGHGGTNLPSSNPVQGNYGQNPNQEMSAGESHKGTIKPHPNFNAEQDCEVLRKAMKGLGTDEKAIIECLGRRNLDQRLQIKKTYKTMFGKDLIDSLKSEISGNFCQSVIESLYDSDYYDAHSLHHAMSGAGTREDVLTEILTSRTNEEIENIKKLYKTHFKKDLEKDIVSETSGFYKRVLVSCLQANKKELTKADYDNLRQHGASAVVNANQASQEAAELFNAGEKKLGTDEAIFIKIFATRNKYQLRATFNAYEKLSGHNIIKAIETEMSGDLASALKAIALQNMNEPLYFASRLYKAMKGAGTTDNALIRIILSRSEIDLENIKKEFQKQYNQTLEAFVKDDVSGDYMKYLIRFVEGN